MATPAEVRALLRRLDGEPADAIESETLECKPWDPDPKALHRTLREYVVCLANARGGTLVLGIRDRTRSRRDAIQGVGAHDPAALKRAIYDGTDPHILVDIEELVEPEGALLLIQVPRGIPPHTTSEGLAKIRIGKECKPLTGRALAQLLVSSGQRDPTAEPVPAAALKDLEAAEIAQLRNGLARELARLDDRALLEALGLISSGQVTLGALLLVGRRDSLTRFVPQHEVTFLRYRNGTRYDQRRDLRGCLLSVLRELEQLLSADNRLRTVQQPGFGQLEVPDLSWEVAREAVLNAVCHRDYFQRQAVQVARHRDRLEIISPGGFPGGITPENVLRHPPVHRNELLARAFQAAGLVNRVGAGVDRIYEGLLRLGKEAPRYSADESHVRLVIPLVTQEAFAAFVATESRRRPLELEDLLLLRALVSAATLDRWSAATVLQLDQEQAARRLAALREAGHLVARGRGRGVRYDLSRPLSARFRASLAPEDGFPAGAEATRVRLLALLRERGRLSNAEVRQFSGLSRTQVYGLLKELKAAGQVRFAGKGRGAHIVPAVKKSRRRIHEPARRSR